MESIKIARELANILSEKDLAKISYKSKDVAICVEAQTAPAVMLPPPLPPSSVITHTAPIFNATAGAADGTPAAPAAPAVKSGKYVTSPIVGTFYAAPAPDKAPFVQIGDKVTKGQVVCIVESMKLMNEINCEFDGTVAAILALDGEAVDFGKELIEIV
jgi:acetyl-CoA carboxylase biotin carboxyl carrier protein